jgi:asparagine synthase (glutamine-hydrolysing)
VYRGVQQRGYLTASEDARWPAAEVERAYEADVLDRAESAYRHHDRARGRLEAVLMGDLSLYLPHLLNRQDKNTMQRSIETRTPFLDPEVVTLALNLPLEARIEPSRKGILRDLGSLYLPGEVARRPKVGFGFEVDQYIRPAMRPEFLLNGRVRDLFPVTDERWRAGVTGLARKPLLLFVTSEIWCRAFLEGDSMEAIDAELWNAAA